MKYPKDAVRDGCFGPFSRHFQCHCMFEGSRSQACSGPLVQLKDHSQSEASYRQLKHVEPLDLNDVLSSTQCISVL